ncbi:MAG: choice-of-anchor J domain-containing protein, partial [Muribaculaceae bacterium]|nr:choice-of-anchor J domain-containing protein [Muribaculaceae bacterium]
EYDCWSIKDFGLWSLHDLDKGEMSGIGYQGKIMPHFREPYAWIVWNPYEFELNLDEYPAFIPHSGEQFIATFNAFYPWELPNGSNDDWIISPELSGHPQEISFFVGKYLDNFGKEEKYEILWSDGSTNPADFTLLAAEEVERSKWYEVKYQLPDGAKRFAIRYVGVDQYAVFIDDITYEPPVPVLKGFNVYRNGSLEAFTEKETYQIDHSHSGDRYSVTALYGDSESDLTRDILYTSGIATVTSMEEGSNIYYFINGQTAAANEDAFCNLPSGIYLKKNIKSGKVTKIIKK